MADDEEPASALICALAAYRVDAMPTGKLSSRLGIAEMTNRMRMCTAESTTLAGSIRSVGT